MSSAATRYEVAALTGAELATAGPAAGQPSAAASGSQAKSSA